VALYWDLHCATTKQATIFRMIAFSVLVGLTTLASTTTIFGNGSQFSAWRVVAAMGFAGLLLFLKRYDERIASLNYLDGLKLCGVICYSIYLTHLFPVKLLCQQLSFLGYRDDWSIFCMCIPLTLTMSILLGYVFHVSVERRFLDVRYNIANKESRSNPHRTSETPRETPGLEEFHRDAPANPPVKKAA